MKFSTRTASRVLAAACLLVSGGIHLHLYFDGYRDFPNRNLGHSFLANVAASALVALALLFYSRWPVLLAGVAVADGSLVAFALSRTDKGIFGFNEHGWYPIPEAALAVSAEIAAAVFLVALLAWGNDRVRDPSPSAPPSEPNS